MIALLDDKLRTVYRRLTVLDGDFASRVFRTQSSLISALFLSHNPDCALTVWTVVGRVLTQLQSGLVS